MIENLPTFLKQTQSLDLIGTSEDFYLKNFHRIRAHLSGNSERKKIKKTKQARLFHSVFKSSKGELFVFYNIKANTVGWESDYGFGIKFRQWSQEENTSTRV